jgi:hypothetical protein
MPHNQTLTTTDRPTLDATSLNGFQANPHLAVAKLVVAMNRNAGVAPTVRADLAAALDRATVEQFLTAPARDQAHKVARRRPRALPGSVGITRNRTSAAGNRTLCFAPTAADHAALLAGEHLAHDLLASGMPDSLAAQYDAIAHFADPIFAAYEVRRLERRGVQTAEAAARHFINHGQPAGLTFVRAGHLLRWWAEQRLLTGVADDSDADIIDSADIANGDAPVDRLLRRPRLAWAHPDGLEYGFLLDRFHHTHQRGAIGNDTWVHGKVAQDLTSIDALLRHPGSRSGAPAPDVANLGVRVHAHRAPNVGVHFLPDYTDGRPTLGRHHRIGGCQHCTTRLALPNTQLAAQPTTQSTPRPRALVTNGAASAAGAGVRS